MEQLDITQLDEIQEALRTSHFSPPNWFPLGLSLGLLKPTLDTIEAEPRNNVSRCLLECLCQWLSKTDKVVEKGGPTWDSLANALRNIGDIASAEKINEIKTELSNPACQILIKNSARLSQLVLPVELLFTEGVISKETFNELKMSGGSLVSNSFKSLRSAISTNHYKLKVFASILLQSRETAQVATDILEEYMHTFPALSPQISETGMDIVVNEHGTTPSGATDSALEVAVVNVQFDEKHNFNQMRIYFGTLVNTVAHFIEAAVPSLEDLKTYLQICYDELRFQLELADSFKKVMFIVKDKNTIIDIDCLQAIVDYFNIEEAKDHIAAYKIAIEEFCEEIKLSLCCNENFKTESSSLLTCETIKFVLEWEANEYSLCDIRVLLQKAFKEMAKKVQVRCINESNSIVVTCYIPRNLTDILLMEAEKNLDLLKGVGLIKLTIGYYTIWDRFTRDKEVAELEKEVALVKGRFTKDNKVALLEEMELAKQLLQEKEREIDSMKSLLEENKVSTSEKRVSQDQQSSFECLSEPELRMRLEVESKISKAKTLQLTRHKEMTAILTVQLRERDEKISQLMEKVKALQSQMLVLHSSLEHNDPELNQRCEDKVTSQQDSTNLHSVPSQKKLSSDHRVDDTSEDFSLDHEMKGNVKWHDTGVDLISPTTKQSEHAINKLKKQQQAKNQWWMYLWSSPPNSSLLVFSNLNDCPLWKLEIYNTTLDSRCLFELSYALTYNKTLEILRLYSSPLTPSGIKLISNAVSTNTTLKTLGLWYDNTVTDEDIPHLGIMLSRNTTLEQFYLYACHNITDIGKKYLAEALTNNKTLTTLYINDFYLC